MADYHPLSLLKPPWQIDFWMQIDPPGGLTPIAKIIGPAFPKTLPFEASFPIIFLLSTGQIETLHKKLHLYRILLLFIGDPSMVSAVLLRAEHHASIFFGYPNLMDTCNSPPVQKNITDRWGRRWCFQNLLISENNCIFILDKSTFWSDASTSAVTNTLFLSKH